jgi:RimJ/RimL family protein N-acetyltransferase
VFGRVLDVPGYPSGELRLIEPAGEHAPLSLRWLREPEVGRYMGADFSSVSAETEERRVREILDGDDVYGWMIELDGQVIGAIEINRIRESSGRAGARAASLSILIGDKRHWGQRIAPHAESAVLDWAFAEGGFEVIIAEALVPNERSWRGLERLDFEFRSLRPDAVNGRPAEWRVYAMTRERWQGRNRPA